MLRRLLRRSKDDDRTGDDVAAAAEARSPEADADAAEGNGSRRPAVRDLYQSDLDRHLWTLPERKKQRKKRTIARWVASAAGMLGAAGLSYWLYRKRKESDELEDPRRAQAED